MKRVTIHEAKTHLARLLENVAAGLEVIICRRDRPVARLVAIRRKAIRREHGRGKGLARIAKDFDVPLADFAVYER
jgi:prevent-host-death family protein